MRTPKLGSAILAIGLGSIIACAERAEPSLDSAAITEPAATDSVPATSRDASDRWTISPSGIGPIHVGMSVEDVSKVAGSVPPVPGGECQYIRPPTLPTGVALMVVRGEVARVDVDSAGVRTTEGIAVGDSASRLDARYAGRSTTTPHKYVPGARYVSARGRSLADSSNRLVFEVDSGRVLRYRAGRLPEVEWVERCG